jgi:hypothetical protein
MSLEHPVVFALAILLEATPNAPSIVPLMVNTAGNMSPVVHMVAVATLLVLNVCTQEEACWLTGTLFLLLWLATLDLIALTPQVHQSAYQRTNDQSGKC